jgi:recombination protein RecR
MSILPQPLKDLIDDLESLPGLGPRSAARIAYYLLRAPKAVSKSISDNLVQLKDGVKICKKCYNYSDSEVCTICSNPSRDASVILIAEEPLDVLAFEKMGEYKGLYHVLGGVISPVNGIGPDEIRLKELIERVKNKAIKELIIATNPNLEGESTALYIKKEIDKLGGKIKVTRLARGLPTGADLEYADEMTLQKALEGRSEI